MNEVMSNICEYLSDQFNFGKEIVGLLQAQCSSRICVVVCPDHLGDTFWAGSFSNEVKTQHGYREILYACKKEHENMLLLFPDIDMTAALEPDEMEAVKMFFYLHQKNREGDVFFSGFPFYVGIHYPSVQLNQITPSMDGSLNRLFEVFLGLTSPTRKSHIRIIEDGKEKEREERYHKVVLLSTGAYSVEAVPMEFWVRLAKVIRSKGYDVYVNDGGKDCDKMIPGVQSMSLTVPELCKVAQHLALFVGLRSGLCDVLAQTPVKMAVIFSSAHKRNVLEVTEQDMWTHNVYEMDRKEGIYAYQFVPELTELLIYRICEILP